MHISINFSEQIVSNYLLIFIAFLMLSKLIRSIFANIDSEWMRQQCILCFPLANIIYCPNAIAVCSKWLKQFRCVSLLDACHFSQFIEASANSLCQFTHEVRQSAKLFERIPNGTRMILRNRSAEKKKHTSETKITRESTMNVPIREKITNVNNNRISVSTSIWLDMCECWGV